MVWKIKDIAYMCSRMQSQKFDCIIAFCGKRGLSKSTGAYRLGKCLKFKPKRDIVFSREELQKALISFDRTIHADEMINAGYKREFYNTEQIELVKILNMYRDHRNVLILCIPNFWDLDKPLRDMVKIRIDMIRRGFGVVHKQKQNIYTNDGWDTKYNQKVEQSFIRKGIYKPKYSKLTTMVGFLRFKQLSEKDERKYQLIKDLKRSKLKMIEEKSEEIKNNEFADGIINFIKFGKIKDYDDLQGIAFARGIDFKTLVFNINRRLKDHPELPSTLKKLFVDIKKKNEPPKIIVKGMVNRTLG
jgi:hypothetical protein